MKKQFITLVFIYVSTVSFGQVNEIGLLAGGTNYVGDIGRTNYIYPNNIGGGIIYKRNWNPRIALRATYRYLPIKGDDTEADNTVRQNRGFTFSNTINELALGLEFNFYEYDLSSGDKSATPYILLEVAGFNYKTPQSEIAPGQYTYTNTTSYSIPFGVGYKSRLFGKLAIAVEAKFSYSFKDDLDHTTNKIPSLDFGGKGNDWYMFTGVSVVYTFGRPSCYSYMK